MQIAKLAGSLALVLALLYGALYSLKRWGGRWLGKGPANPWIEVLAQHSFGPKHHLLVVKVQESHLLIGVSPQGMQLLTPVSGPAEESLKGEV